MVTVQRTDVAHAERRLCSPAPEYAEAFRPARQLLTMVAVGGQLLSITISIEYSRALAALLRVRQLDGTLGRLHTECSQVAVSPCFGPRVARTALVGDSACKHTVAQLIWPLLLRHGHSEPGGLTSVAL